MSNPHRAIEVRVILGNTDSINGFGEAAQINKLRYREASKHHLTLGVLLDCATTGPPWGLSRRGDRRIGRVQFEALLDGEGILHSAGYVQCPVVRRVTLSIFDTAPAVEGDMKQLAGRGGHVKVGLLLPGLLDTLEVAGDSSGSSIS